MLKKTLTNTVTDSSTSMSHVSLRKSINSLQLTPAQRFEDNDDEAERLALRSNSEKQSTSTPRNNSSVSSPSSRRYSFGLSNLMKVPEPQMKEHISHCIKLSTENKINLKNAFSLEIIDFMTFIFTKKKSRITDLQGASVTLDVSTKLYGYRVDNLYSMILKIGSGADKQQNKNESNSNEPEASNENRPADEEAQAKSQTKTKKKKNTQKVCSTESALKGNIETIYPSESIIGSGDSCTSDMLYQAVLPNHATSGFHHHLHKDVILDTLDVTSEQDVDSAEYTIPAIENYSTLNICQSFSNFKLLNWSEEDDEEEMLNPTEKNNESRFQFDLDKTSLSVDDHNSEPMNYSGIQDNENNGIPCKKKPGEVENIVDFRDIVAAQVFETQTPSEYSCIQKDLFHWAGPSYWKIKSLGKVSSSSKIVETCHHAAVKKKKDIVLSYEDINATFEQSFLPNQSAKTKLKAVPVNWVEEAGTLPEDIHYDALQQRRLYLYVLPNENLSVNEEQSNEMDVAENESFDFNNENDFCPDISTHEEIQEENPFDDLRAEDNDMVESQEAFLGSNLVVAPQLTQKINLPYSSRAKKIDMRQLKQTIWKSLISVNNDEKNTQTSESQNKKEIKEPKPFSKIYKSLSKTLSKTNAEALSLPIAFISLLHLANEKSLKLALIEDMSDFIVDQD